MQATIENKPRKSWLEIKNTSTTAVEIYIMGDIVDEKWTSEDVTPNWFRDELKSVKDAKHIHIFINSGGGSVFAALAIHNMIKNTSAFVTTHIMGIAASAASWMIMPSNKIVMPENAFMMLHLPVSGLIGNKNDFISEAKFLEKVEDVIVDSYMRGGKKLTKEAVKDMLNAGETWLNGKQALDAGLIDFLEPSVAVANKGNYVAINGVDFDPSKFSKFPCIEEKDINNQLISYSNRFSDIKKSIDLSEYENRINKVKQNINF